MDIKFIHQLFLQNSILMSRILLLRNIGEKKLAKKSIKNFNFFFKSMLAQSCKMLQNFIILPLY